MEQISQSQIPRNLMFKKQYRLESNLGEGTYGEVNSYSILSKVAVKQFKSIPTEKELIELEIMKKIKSKYLCKLIDAFINEDNQFMIVQKLAKHGDLLNYCKKTLYWEIPESLAKEWLAQVCLGLNELHSKNIIHRDIKPENILVQDKLHLRLSDFGQSKIVEHDIQKMIATNSLAKGTPQYMSPEMKNLEEYDYSTDIYSLGITFALLLSQEFPKIQEISDNSWTPRFKNGNDYQQDFIDLIKQMIRFNKNQRIKLIDIIQHPLLQDTQTMKEYREFMLIGKNRQNLQVQQFPLPRCVFKASKLIGEGDIGFVYLCQLLDGQEQFVMKRWYQQPDRQMQNSVIIHKNLKSNYITPLIDAFYDNQKYFCTIENFAEFGDVQHYLRKFKEQLSEKLVLEWLAQVALGLLHMHENHIIHRAVTPNNILVYEHQKVRLSGLDYCHFQVNYNDDKILKEPKLAKDFSSDIYSLAQVSN
eukprot:403371806